MADFFRREVTTRRVEFVVPMKHESGIKWTEVIKAIRAAHSELWASGRFEDGKDVPDNVITLVPGDEDIVVRYQIEEAVSDGR